MSYNPISIANKIIGEKNNSLTIMELLKLEYIAHGYHLAIFDKPLFKAEIQAWPYGPVVKEVYNAFRNTQGICIKKPADISGVSEDVDDNTMTLLREVIKIYKDKDGWELSALTHEDDSPWTQIVRQKGFYNVIPDSLIKDYYKNLISRNGNG